MAESGSAFPLLSDFGALRDHVGGRGVPLTETGHRRSDLVEYALRQGMIEPKGPSRFDDLGAEGVAAPE